MTNLEPVIDEIDVVPQIDQELDRFCLQVAIEGGNSQLTFFNKLEFLLLTLRSKPLELPKAFRLVFSVELGKMIETVRGRLSLNFIH